MSKYDEDRTTPLGLFNTAESFWRGAGALKKVKVRSTHADHPVYFLYYCTKRVDAFTTLASDCAAQISSFPEKI
jgi:hypothetical protein